MMRMQPWSESFNPACLACRKSWMRRVPAFAGGSNWPLLSGSNALDDIGTNAAISSLTALTANSTANVKGTTYTPLIASTAQAYDGLYVFVHGNSTTAGRGLIDLAIGASGSEVVLMPDIFFWTIIVTALRKWTAYYFPIAVPSGVRLSMRAQASVASWALRVGCLGVPRHPMNPTGFSRCTAYGVDLTDSGGTAIDGGAVANTKGAYAVLASSTANPMKAMMVGIGGSTTTAPAAITAVLVDVSVGAATAEQPVISNMPWSRSNSQTTETATNCYAPLGVNIPAATRLTARCQASGTDANGRLQDVIVYGFD